MSVNTGNWERLEGVIIAEELDPRAVAEFIVASRVVTNIDWYDRTPNLIGLTLAAQDGRLATVNDEDEIVPSTECEDFALDLSRKFEAEVMIGDIAADSLPEDADFTLPHPPSDEPTRVVELSATSESSVPLLAALEGIDLGASTLPNGWTAIYYELDADEGISPVGDFPCVVLAMSGNEFRASLMLSSDSEEWVMYNWAMSSRTIAAAHAEDRVSRQAESLVGAQEDLRQIALAVPQADEQAALNSVRLRGAPAVDGFVRALGAPTAVSEYLQRHLDVEDVPGVEIHDSRGIANAIGRSVDRLLVEPESSGSALWEAYHKVAVETPWIVRVGAGVEAVTGTALLISALRKPKGRRSGWTKFGAVVGALMVFDSVAEVSLAKYLGLRAERHRQRRNQ
ncbi:MAG: hypothetical protein Q4P06_04930 [Actinomycetaceae bacterium]|nr:hypothetical protein [Actinomycetaceae bacterium]